MNVDPLYIHAAMFIVMLLVLQIALLMVGVSGPEIPDGPDIDVDADFDVEPEFDADVPSGGVLEILGLRGVPLIVWMSAWLAGFSGTGFFLTGLVGELSSPWFLRAPAVLMGFIIARVLGKACARLIPAVTTSSVSLENARSLMGEVTDGTASVGRPARVEVEDHKGGTHYFMAEPVNPDDVIHKGEKVAVLLVTNEETGTRERRIVKI